MKRIRENRSNDIAKEIMNQINAIDRRAFWAWGASEFISGDGKVVGLDKDCEGFLRFKTVNCPKLRRGGKILIALMYDDTYSIVAYRISGSNVKIVAKVEDVYAEDLISTIDEIVG